MANFSPKATLWALGLLPTLVFLAYGSWWALRAALYVPQTVTISKIETLCSIRWRHTVFTRADHTPWTTDCNGQKQLERTRFFGRNQRLQSDLFLSFSYISPANGQKHTGTLRRRHNDQNRQAKPGDRIIIEASRLMPLVITDWSNGSIAEDDRVLTPAKNNPLQR